jgi:hypothetical protein
VLEKYADWKEGNVSGKTVGDADFPKESPSSSETGDQLVCRIILSLSVVSTRDAGSIKILADIMT